MGTKESRLFADIELRMKNSQGMVPNARVRSSMGTINGNGGGAPWLSLRLSCPCGPFLGWSVVAVRTVVGGAVGSSAVVVVVQGGEASSDS